MNDQKQIWLQEAIDLCSDDAISKAIEKHPGLVQKYIETGLPYRDGRLEVTAVLAPLLRRCNAKSRKTFWQWLRITLAKSSETAIFLTWMQESRLKPEVVTPYQRDGFRYVINGDVALIEVVDGLDHAVWQIPLPKLDWALSLYPLHLKKLPDSEMPETAKRRRLEAQLRKKLPFWTPEQQQAVVIQIDELRAREQRAFAPVQRFQLVRYAGGEEFGVHRLFMDAGRGDIVEPLDGDYLNFTTVTIRRTYAPADSAGGFAVRPPVESEEITVPNLYIVHSDESQKDFEKSFLQTKINPRGDIKESLTVQANADLGKRTGVCGFVQDCGSSAPLTPDEIIEVGLQGGEVRAVDQVAAIRRKWQVPRPEWGNQWA
jgi:hypothetical protein